MNDLIDVSNILMGFGRFLTDNARDLVGNTEGLSEICVTIDIPLRGDSTLDINKSYDVDVSPKI